MSEVTVTPSAATITVDPAATKTAPATAAATPPAGEPNEKPTWLDARLERERRAVLKELGIENLEDGKKAIGEAQAKREAEKTATQKAAELGESLKTTKAEKEEMAAALGTYAKAQMKGLSDEQRAAVTAIAGDDAAKQLKAIEALAPTWKSAPTTETKTTKPADTALAATAPKETTTNTSPPDPKAIYAELKKTNFVIAARYAQANNIHDT
jgi:hypothetical protein